MSGSPVQVCGSGNTSWEGHQHGMHAIHTSTIYDCQTEQFVCFGFGFHVRCISEASVTVGLQSMLVHAEHWLHAGCLVNFANKAR